MDIDGYFRVRKGSMNRRADGVKDFSVFDFNHVPEKPFIRQECRYLIDEMLRFDITRIPSHAFIIGSRGSGKTLTLKFLEAVVPHHADLAVRYVNCRHYNTSFKILAHLLGVQARGASLSELYERFRSTCEKKTVLVLDEVDLMSPKDRRREILYLLSRSEHPFMLIMLSNNPHVLKEIDPATRSSLQPEIVHFRNYNAEEILHILKDRATRGLKTFKEADLRHIAALTTRRTNADARVAIKTLFYTVTKRNTDIETCFENARRDVVVDMIHDLSDAALMVLWAVATSKTDFAKNIYNRYCRFCQDRREKPFSYVYFYSTLSYLQSAGLVALVSTKVGRTYTNRVLLTFDQPIVEPITKLRFPA